MNKYLFTKFGCRKNDLMLMDIVPDTDEDYDVADVFLIDYYSDEGETIGVEASNLEEAVYTANRWFGTCVTPNNLLIAPECLVKASPKPVFRITIYEDEPYYVPAPVKIWRTEKGKWTKRSKKYYSDHYRKAKFCPFSPVYDYDNFRKHINL